MKVKVKTHKLEELFNQYHEAVLKGNISRDEAARRLGRSEVEDGVFSEHQTRVREDMRGSKGSGGYSSPIRFADPHDARSPSGAKLVATHRQAQKAAMACIPGEESDQLPNMQDPEGQALHKRAQDLNDAMILLKVLNPSFDWRSSKLYDEYQRATYQATSKILYSTNTNAGAEFIPNTLSSQLIPPFRDALVVAPTLQHFTMTDSPQKYPLMGASMVAYTMGEDTADTQAGTAISRSTPNTDSRTFTARDIKVATYVSEEMNEDSIIPALPMIRTEIGTAIGEGWDDAILNGDRSSTHQDADVTSSTDRRKAINGLRSLVNTDAKVDVSSSVGRLRASDFIAARTKMGRYAQNPADMVILLSYIGIQHMVGDQNIQKLNEFGANATLPRGTVSGILGTPVVPTGFMREGLDSTGVVNAGSSLNTYTIGLQVNRRAFWVGDRRNITIKSEEEILTDRVLVVGTFRGDLQRIASPVAANQRAISMVRGIDTTFANFHATT